MKLVNTQALKWMCAAAFAAAAPGEENPGETGEARSSAGVILAALATVAAFILCIVG